MSYRRRRCDDEGYYHVHCDTCGCNTEHEVGSCIPCDNRYLDHKRIQEARVAKAEKG
jgi:hypothetical protein